VTISQKSFRWLLLWLTLYAHAVLIEWTAHVTLVVGLYVEIIKYHVDFAHMSTHYKKCLWFITIYCNVENALCKLLMLRIWSERVCVTKSIMLDDSCLLSFFFIFTLLVCLVYWRITFTTEWVSFNSVANSTVTRIHYKWNLPQTLSKNVAGGSLRELFTVGCHNWTVFSDILMTAYRIHA